VILYVRALLDPRASMMLAVILLGLAAVAYGVWGWDRRAVVVQAALCVTAVVLAAWHIGVVSFERSLGVERATSARIEELAEGGASVEVTDAASLSRLLDHFARVRTKAGVTKVTSAWRVVFATPAGERRFRVTSYGRIANDVAASAIQDLYVPAVTGLEATVAGLIGSRR
jgi:hypothetical protein